MSMKKQTVTWQKIFDVELYEGTLSAHSFPWHYHDCYIFIMVDSGIMQYHFQKEVVCVKEKEILLINPYEPHFNKPATDSCAYKVVFFSTALFNADLSQNSMVYFEKKVVAAVSFFTKAQQFFKKIQTSMNQKNFESILQPFLSLIGNEYSHAEKKLQFDKRIIPALQYIDLHLNEKITIIALASQCHISSFHFQRIFKQSMGLTVTVYLQQQRMEMSKALIRNGSKIVKAALDTGFFDQSHFHKQFKKMYATTPAQFH